MTTFRDDASRFDERRETSVLIIDDHRSFAEMLSGALSTVPGVRCVEVAFTAAAGIACARVLQPTIVVMDIEMPGQDGLSATRHILEVAPDAVVAVVTAHTEPEWVSRAAQAGASAYIPKDGSLAELIEVLSRARSGQMLVAPSTFNHRPARPEAVADPRMALLSDREQQALIHLGNGLQTDMVARAMGVSVHTCRGYIRGIHSKLGVSSRLEAVVKAQALGMIDAPRGR